MLWIIATLIAAVAQTARNAMQSSLTATLGTLGATQVRFVYGLAVRARVSRAGRRARARVACLRRPLTFLGFTAAAPSRRSCGTALLLAAMQARSFSVATAFSKTEAVQVAVFGVVDSRRASDVDARGGRSSIATVGVVIAAVKPGDERGMRRVCGLPYSASRPAASSRSRRSVFAAGFSRSPDDAYFLRATTTLVVVARHPGAVARRVDGDLRAREALLDSVTRVAPVAVRGLHGRVRVAVLVPGLLADARPRTCARWGSSKCCSRRSWRSACSVNARRRAS